MSFDDGHSWRSSLPSQDRETYVVSRDHRNRIDVSIFDFDKPRYIRYVGRVDIECKYGTGKNSELLHVPKSNSLTWYFVHNSERVKSNTRH